jgi:anaerobic ribonucleoside-triphosphate reductase activating protein
MPQMDLVVDTLTGAVLVRDPERIPDEVTAHLAASLGPGHELACAAPIALRQLPAASPTELAADACVRIAGYFHNSLVEGPGRRSTAKFQGCPVRCRGCVTPESWEPTGGDLAPVGRLADALLDPAYERDGVSILGGEPFFQPDGLCALVGALRARGCRHILAYSGYTYERLRWMAARHPAVDAVLDEIEVLIDGPYVAALADSAGPWTGSGNQRVIDLPATRRADRVVLQDMVR